MKHITKKNIIGSVIAITFLAVGVYTYAATTYSSFTFDYLLRTSADTEYAVDLISGESLIKDDSGRYDLEARLGFYGTTDPATDSLFESEIRSKINVWYKRKGAPAYEHMMLTYLTSGITTPGIPGRTVVNVMRSSSNGYLVEPGIYTVDAIMFGTTKLASYEICLPTFISNTGRSIGSVTCDISSSTSTTTDVSFLDTRTDTPTLSFTPTSIVAPDTAAQIKGLLKSPANTIQKIEFWVGLKNASKAKSSTSDPISITPAGFPLSVTASDLKNKKDYEYGFRLSGESTDFFTGAFSTGIAGNQITTAPVSAATVTFDLVSLMAQATTATIKGTFKATADTTEKFNLYVWPSGGTPQKIQTSDSIKITPVGFPITFPVITGLQAETGYGYKIVAVGSGKTVYENSFVTNLAVDQAGSSAGTSLDDGVCGSATVQAQAAAPSGAALCKAGTPGPVSPLSAGWTWICYGKNDGADTPCIAKSLSSAGSAVCGSANGATRPYAPSAEGELCGNGVAGTVSETGTGWSWTCATASDGGKSTCSATKGAATPDESQNDLPSNFLQNPFKELDSFPKIIKAVVNNIVLPIAVPFIAIMIIYSGFLFVVARKKGNVDGYAKAKQTLMYTLIGAALVLGSFVIANALQGTLDSIVSIHYVQINTVTRV